MNEKNKEKSFVEEGMALAEELERARQVVWPPESAAHVLARSNGMSEDYILRAIKAYEESQQPAKHSQNMTDLCEERPGEMDQLMQDLLSQLESIMHEINNLYETLAPYLTPEIPVIKTINESETDHESRVALYSPHGRELDGMLLMAAELRRQLQILNMRVMP